MNNHSLVSIIMNCLNGEKYLSKALESVMRQTYQNWELIFWDNQSTDKSAEIVRSYTDDRIKYYYAPKKTILYEARNYAIKNASGEFVAFLDVDDWWSANKLELQLPLFKDRSVGIVYGKYYIYDSELNKYRKPYFCHFNLSSGKITNDLLKTYSIGLVSLVARMSAIKDANYFNNSYHIIGDFDLSINISLKWNIACVQKQIAFYRLHSNSESHKNKELFIKELTNWYKDNYQKLIKYKNFKCINLLISKEKSLFYLNNNKKIFIIYILKLIKTPLDFIKIIGYIFLNNKLINKIKIMTAEPLE